jgi:hypothetical protein
MFDLLAKRVGDVRQQMLPESLLAREHAAASTTI